MNAHDLHTDDLKEQAKKIGEQSQDIRKKIEELVKNVKREVKDRTKPMADVAQDVMDGASEGIRQAAPPEDQENRLRQVIDGLADGLSIAATASRLAIEEAKSRGEQFAKQDMNELLKDIQTLKNMFVDVVTRTASKASATAKGEAADTVNHAKRTYQSLKPSLDQAINAAKGDPSQLADETAQAVNQASRKVAGALFSAVGELMQHAAGKMDPKYRTSSTADTRQAGSDAQAEDARTKQNDQEQHS